VIDQYKDLMAVNYKDSKSSMKLRLEEGFQAKNSFTPETINQLTIKAVQQKVRKYNPATGRSS